MGQAFTYRCDRCGFEARFNEGHGFMIHPQPLNNYLHTGEKLFHHKTHKVLKKLDNKDNQLFINACFKIFKCPNCNLLYDKVAVTVYDDGTIVHKSEFRCNECRARLRLTNIHRLKRAVCPVCKKPSFRNDPRKMVLWD